MTWDFLNTGFHPGAFNMDLDRSLADRLLKGEGNPTLRVYAWDPPAISIGYNQSMDDFDTRKLREAGVDIVRRPTGGRAILHAHELTYSVVMKTENRTLREIYRLINEALLRGLCVLGIDARLVDATDSVEAMYRNPSSIPCFASSSKSEIQFNGRKLLGSAQRRYGDVVLQHGSLLLGPQHQRLMEFLSRPPERQAEESLSARAIDAETILGRDVTFEEAAAAVKLGFERLPGVVFSEDQSEEAGKSPALLQPSVH
jgi:lipoate-protein ligase A